MRLKTYLMQEHFSIFVHRLMCGLVLEEYILVYPTLSGASTQSLYIAVFVTLSLKNVFSDLWPSLWLPPWSLRRAPSLYLLLPGFVKSKTLVEIKYNFVLTKAMQDPISLASILAPLKRGLSFHTFAKYEKAFLSHTDKA